MQRCKYSSRKQNLVQQKCTHMKSVMSRAGHMRSEIASKRIQAQFKLDRLLLGAPSVHPTH